jgi:hypothetical protein
MKNILKLFFTLLILMTLTEYVIGNADGLVRINKIYIKPEISAVGGPVTLMADITTLSNGKHLGYSVSRYGNTFVIEDCFFVGMLTVVNYFTVEVPLGILNPGIYYVKYIAYQSASQEICKKDPMYSDTMDFKFIVRGKIRLDFRKGWNIFSVNYLPENNDVKELFRPLMDNGSLVKIQDQVGNSLEDHGIFEPFGGWYSNIDSICPAEGYKIKVITETPLEITGFPVEYPFKIPLKTGWNIVGYPRQTEAQAKAVIQQLIERGKLVKVQDEMGNSIENFGVFGGWQNYIGQFTPGKGYKIKVSSADTLTIYESYP